MNTASNKNERAPLLSTADQEQLLKQKKRSNRSSSSSSSSESWKPKAAMITVTCAILGAAAVTRQSSDLPIEFDLKPEEKESAVANMGSKTAQEELQRRERSGGVVGKLGSTEASDMVTLTLGCTAADTLGLLPFDPKGYSGQVGAKLSLKSVDHNFDYNKAIEMTEIGCGTFAVAHKLQEGEQFGFYLYDVNNTTKFLSDIGAQAIVGGPISDADRNVAAWGAETEINEEKNASEKKRLEDGVDNLAKQEAVRSDASAVAYAGQRGFIDASGNFVADPTPENAAAFSDANKDNWWDAYATHTDYDTMHSQTKYFDWGAWIKWIIHGPDHKEQQIECDKAAATCTLQDCKDWECTDYTMPCLEGNRGCTEPEDFTGAAALGGQKKVSVRKYDKRKEVATQAAKEQSKTNEEKMNTNKRNLLWKQTTSSKVPQLGMGKAYPTRVIVYMAACTKEKSFGKDDMSGVEFFPRTKDNSNPGNVYMFGQCFNVRDTATCETPTEHHPSGCGAAPGAAPTSGISKAQQNANTVASVASKAAEAASTTSSTSTDNSSGSGSGSGSGSSSGSGSGSSSGSGSGSSSGSGSGSSSSSDSSSSSAASASTSTSSTETEAEKNPLTDSNIHAAVLACLSVDPKTGVCPDESWGSMSGWNTKKITNMDKLFYDPPLADSSDRLSSFNGLIGDWDVSGVTSMKQMFKDADAFTGKNFYKWDTSHVTDMSGMFEHATVFNAQIGGWRVPKVQKMNTMFQNAFTFNQDLSTWDISSVTDFTRMFAGTLEKGFAQDLSVWSGNIQSSAKQNNITYENYAHQAKFTCDTEDDGPIETCVAKSSAERASAAKLAKAKSSKITREEATQEAREMDKLAEAKEKSWMKPSTWFKTA